jgi:GMP synthase (glutamine-hydrolysing)
MADTASAARATNSAPETVLVLDFGAQYAQLIARRVRENHVFCRILPCTASFAEVQAVNPKAIILSGGPASVWQQGSPRCAPEVLHMDVPILGLCYGMQLLAVEFGGKVAPADHREFGRAQVEVVDPNGLFANMPRSMDVWMSHGDRVEALPPGWTVLAQSDNAPFAAARDPKRPVIGLQFHPEVAHTPRGREILKNFLFNVAGCRGDWVMSRWVEETTAKIRAQVGTGKVVCGLSGGVDSTVVGEILRRAIGDQLVCIFVDTGLLRLGDRELMETDFRPRFGSSLVVADAEPLFLERLAGVIDPEKKRKIIGHAFIDVFKREAAVHAKGARFLAQGTLYPDVIESVSAFGGPTAVIKTHHNVGGLPAELGFDLVEPLRELFKDEVREIGREMGLPDALVWRHPFPGPGLAVRCIGEVTKKRLDVLRKADKILTDELTEAGLMRSLWQAFCVLLPVHTVGVMGDERTYDQVCAIRVVTSEDAMTADWAQLPDWLLRRVSNRISNEVRGISRVVLDISSKPPATIEWE